MRLVADVNSMYTSIFVLKKRLFEVSRGRFVANRSKQVSSIKESSQRRLKKLS